MSNPSRLQLQTETQPGKPRDPFLEQQMSQIENAVNANAAALLSISGIWNTVAISADYAATNLVTAIFGDTTAGSLTVTLPCLKQGSPVGKVYAITNWQGANNVAVVMVLEDMSNTQTVATLAAGQSVIVCHGPGILGYYIFGSH